MAGRVVSTSAVGRTQVPPIPKPKRYANERERQRSEAFDLSSGSSDYEDNIVDDPARRKGSCRDETRRSSCAKPPDAVLRKMAKWSSDEDDERCVPLPFAAVRCLRLVARSRRVPHQGKAETRWFVLTADARRSDGSLESGRAPRLRVEPSGFSALTRSSLRVRSQAISPRLCEHWALDRRPGARRVRNAQRPISTADTDRVRLGPVGAGAGRRGER